MIEKMATNKVAGGYEITLYLPENSTILLINKTTCKGGVTMECNEVKIVYTKRDVFTDNYIVVCEGALKSFEITSGILSTTARVEGETSLPHVLAKVINRIQ